MRYCYALKVVIHEAQNFWLPKTFAAEKQAKTNEKKLFCQRAIVLFLSASAACVVQQGQQIKKATKKTSFDTYLEIFELFLAEF